MNETKKSPSQDSIYVEMLKEFAYAEIESKKDKRKRKTKYGEPFCNTKKKILTLNLPKKKWMKVAAIPPAFWQTSKCIHRYQRVLAMKRG